MCSVVFFFWKGSDLLKNHNYLVRLVLCALFAAILCICSPLTIPIGPIPFSMAIFAVMLCGVVLDWRSAIISVLVYLALGLFLPIFSGGKTGLSALPGPTGGYIWSYLLMIPVIFLIEQIPFRFPLGDILAAFLGCVAAIAVCYLCGTIQFCFIAGVRFQKALSVCVIPFAPFDLLKAAAASLLGVSLRKILLRMGYLTSGHISNS